MDSLLRISAWRTHISFTVALLGNFYAWLSGRHTDLAVNEVTDGHPHLHADPQDSVVVDVLEDGQDEGGQRQGGGVAVHSHQAPLVAGLVTFKVLDDFPQQEWLDYFYGLLQEGRGDGGGGQGAYNTCFSRKEGQEGSIKMCWKS